MQELTEAQICTLAHAWLQETLATVENERLQRKKLLTRYEIEHFLGVSDELRDAVQDDLLAHNSSGMAETAEEVLRQNGIEADRALLSFRECCRELLKVSLRFHEEDKKRLLGCLRPRVSTGSTPASTGLSILPYPSPTSGALALRLIV